MVLFNMCGIPDSGKTTAAKHLTLFLKKAGYLVEEVGESSREYAIYEQSLGKLENQVLMTGLQYERIKRLSRIGFDIAVNDSPLIQGTMYCKGLSYHKELMAVIRKLEPEFETYNVLVHKFFPFNAEFRIQQSEAEVRALETDVLELHNHKFWLEIYGNDEGHNLLTKKALEVIQHIPKRR